MKVVKYIKSVFLVIICAAALTSSNLCSDKVTAQPVETPISANVLKETILGVLF